MIYTSQEYASAFPFGKKFVSAKTINRRCVAGMLPKGHHARKLPGKTGAWVIEVTEGVINENIARFYNINITKK